MKKSKKALGNVFYPRNSHFFGVVLDLRHVSNEGAAGAYAPLPDFQTLTHAWTSFMKSNVIGKYEIEFSLLYITLLKN